MATQVEIDEVRLNIGDTSASPTLSDSIIDAKIENYPTADYTTVERVYFATLDCLILLKANAIAASSFSKQKVGDVEISSSSGSDNAYRLYCDLYNWYMANPPVGVSALASFAIGGVSKAELARVEDDPDSVGSGIKQGWFSDDSYTVGNETGSFSPDNFREL